MVKKVKKENSSTTTGKHRKKIEQKKTGLYYKQRTILDMILFLTIIIALSMSVLFFSFLPRETNVYYIEYQDTEEYMEYSMQTILASTVPKVVYKNNNGIEDEFIDKSIEELILLDLYIRYLDPELNITSLSHGLEQTIKNGLINFLENEHKFVLKAELDLQEQEQDEQIKDNSSNSKLIITNLEKLNQFNEHGKPNFKKLVYIPGTELPTVLAENDVVIQLYLID